MNAIKQSIWLFSLIILLPTLSFYIVKTPLNNNFDGLKLENIADVMILKLEVSQFDAYGNIINKLYTLKMHHIPKNHMYRLQKPKILILNKNNANWNISSNYADTLNGNQKITFHNNVIVIQKTLIGENNNTLHTNKLIYYPQKQSVT